MKHSSDVPGQEPNLELPSFGFGRRKKRARKASDDATEVLPATPEPTAEEAVGEPESAEPEPEPAAPTVPLPTAPRAPAAPPAPARAADVASTSAPGPTPARPPARPAARPAARPPSRSSAPAAPPAPAPARPAAAQPVASPPPAPAAAPPPAPEPAEPAATEPEPFIETTVIDPLDEAAAALDAPRRGRSRRQESRAQRRAAKAEAKRAEQQAASYAEPEPEPEARAAAEPEPATEPDTRAPADALVARLPAINPLLAAIITGLLSGLVAVLLAFGAVRGCDAVRGTESCGGGLGLLAIVAILALEVIIGATLLKAWQISDPVSTSFLGVGLVATIAMLVFLDRINSSSMLVVIPLMTAAAFALSWWVTVKFVDEHPMTSEADAEHGEPAFREIDQDEDSNA